MFGKTVRSGICVLNVFCVVLKMNSCRLSLPHFLISFCLSIPSAPDRAQTRKNPGRPFHGRPGVSLCTGLKKVLLEFCFLQGIKELVEPADNLRHIRLALIERHMEAHAVVDIDQQPGHKFRRNVSRKNAV